MNDIQPLESHEFCFVVDNGNLLGDEHELFFQCPAEDVITLDKDATMADILVHCGVFRSKSQARKDQKWGQKLDIHLGFTHIPSLGKKRRNIAILKPDHTNQPSTLEFPGDKSDETR